MKLLLLLGQKRYGDDAERLLWHICRSYSLTRDNFVIGDKVAPFHYCYYAPPASKRDNRDSDRRARLKEIIELYERFGPFKIVGFGWMTADLLLNVGKSKTKSLVGAKWKLVHPGMITETWITYDPAAALFDPNMVVDIAQVIVLAAEDAGIQTEINPNLEPFDWSKYL